MKTETWKACVEHPNYEVSDHGRIRSIRTPTSSKRFRQIILKPYVSPKGYHSVCLGKAVHNRSVHTIVLTAFVGPCPSGMECRHKDGDPGNNHLDNLCWGTPEENSQDKKLHGTENYRLGEDCSWSKLTAKIVRRIRRLYADGKKKWGRSLSNPYSQPKLAKMFGLHQATVSEIVTRKIWKHLS